AAEDIETLEYVKFARWQRELRQGEFASQAEEFWKRHSPDDSAAGIPLRQGGVSKGFEVRVQGRVLPRNTAALLDDAARQAGVRPKALLLAGWQTLLWRISEQSEVVTGTAFEGREFELMRGSLGLFSRWLPVGNRLTASYAFESLARKINRFLEKASEWQDYYQMAGEDGKPDPRFALGFEFEERFEQVGSSGQTCRLIHQFCCTERFELKLVCALQEGELGAEIHYDPARYRAEDASRLGRWFGVLLESALRRPQGPISGLELMGRDEIHQLLVEWGRAEGRLPRHPLVPELFEEQARSRSDALALGSQPPSASLEGLPCHLSYGELQRRTLLLARYLQVRGVGPEKTVGILMQRSEEMLGAVLAVIRAGGAYLPLDPAYPSDRLAFMLDDAQSLCLLTQPPLLGRLPALSHLAVCPEQDWAEIASQPEQDWRPAQIDARNLAYLIYTSGSTGRPKGVAVTHASLLNLVEWHRRQYEVSPSDRASQVAGVGFDASVWEVWPYWTSGSALLVADEETRLSPQGLRDWLLESQVTLSFVPTPLMEGLLLLDWEGREEEERGRNRTGRGGKRQRGAQMRTPLRAALTGGDRLLHAPPPSLPFEVINHYGPAESTVVTTAGRVRPGQDGPPPIGRPIANLEVLIMDRWGNPLPQGIAGELQVGGKGLARGYAASARQTAELFRPHPFKKGERLYRTGDRVRWRADGEVEFLGRIDHQIKIRGFRIELGEIEAVLSSHSSIQACAVVARESRPGERYLVAYAADPDGLASPAELNAFLGEQLPDFML
ncbi:MAG: amino acid adenylation domain-containing protein, partial [Acidobacteriota bacterium]